jgi:hypothetical protein
MGALGRSGGKKFRLRSRLESGQWARTEAGFGLSGFSVCKCGENVNSNTPFGCRY